MFLVTNLTYLTVVVTKYKIQFTKDTSTVRSTANIGLSDILTEGIGGTHTHHNPKP
jgi:pseudouridine-5'-phosphate glycosidase